MIALQRNMYPVRHITDAQLFANIDRYSPHIFVSYPKLRLVPFFCLIKHATIQILANPFFNFWNRNGNHHLYFGGLPPYLFAQLKRNPLMKSAIVDRIIQEHLYFTHNRNYMNPMEVQERPKKIQKSIHLNIRMIKKKRTQQSRLPRMDKHFANLFLDILEQKQTGKSINFLAEKQQMISTKLAGVVIWNNVFHLDFPYTIATCCDYELIIIIRKDYLEYIDQRYTSDSKIHQAFRYKEKKRVQQYLHHLSKYAELIHHYDCQKSTIFVCYGLQHQLDALLRFIYFNVALKNMMFLSLSLPEKYQKDLLQFTIRNYLRNGAWKNEKIMDDLMAEMQMLEMVSIICNTQNSEKSPQKLKKLLIPKSSRNYMNFRRDLKPDDRSPSLNISIGRNLLSINNQCIQYHSTNHHSVKTERNPFQMLSFSGDYEDNMIIGIHPDSCAIPGVPSVRIDTIIYRLSQCDPVLHNIFYKRELIQAFGYTRIICLDSKSIEMNSFFELADRLGFEIIIFKTVNNQIILLFAKRNLLQIYEELSKIYPGTFRIIVDLK